MVGFGTDWIVTMRLHFDRASPSIEVVVVARTKASGRRLAKLARPECVVIGIKRADDAAKG